jgi:hypothetical protein
LPVYDTAVNRGTAAPGLDDPHPRRFYPSFSGRDVPIFCFFILSPFSGKAVLARAPLFFCPEKEGGFPRCLLFGFLVGLSRRSEAFRRKKLHAGKTEE